MPGERGPSSVPMMPLADFVALSGSLSNHSSRKSAELMVKLGQHAEPLGARPRKCSPRRFMPISSPKESEVGSGGAMASSGFTARAIWCSMRPNSSYASASRSEWRAARGGSDHDRSTAPGNFRPEAGERAFERQDVQAVARKLELADDLRPQQVTT